MADERLLHLAAILRTELYMCTTSSFLTRILYSHPAYSIVMYPGTVQYCLQRVTIFTGETSIKMNILS